MANKQFLVSDVSTRRRIATGALIALLWFTPCALAQSTAQGTIEGSVSDASGGIIPGASVEVTNLDTGLRRNLVTNDRGLFRSPLLNPGENYQVKVELEGFKTYQQSGITVRAGATATLRIQLEVGAVAELVTVRSDAAIVNTASADVGRTMNSTEIENLPLVSRNPYNLGLLQAGVVGRENTEFGVPRFSANGFKSRVNYRIDGNTNTQTDRPGLRLQPISNLFVQEVQLANNGFNAEFGRTTGVVYNAVTKAGTNSFHGEGSYRFRRDSFSAFPFSRNPIPRGSDKPPTKVDNFTGAVGGPILKDRWHFYTGYERLDRDLAGQRVISVSRETAEALRLDPARAIGDGTQGTAQMVDFFLVRSDFQINDVHKWTTRYNLFRNGSPNNVGGGLNTREVSIDFGDASDAFASQVASVFSPNWLNEFRFQFNRRLQDRTTNALSGTGPLIVVSGVANFGGQNSAPQEFNQKIWQIIDNVSFNRGAHSYKFGVDFQYVDDFRLTPPNTRYVFPTTQSYLDAVDGIDPFGYTSFRDQVGDPTIAYDSTFFSFFVQDEWTVSQNLRINYGLRYDYFVRPEADPASLLTLSREFASDGNNWGPRFGLAWSPGDDKKTVLRASYGIFYDAPAINHWLDALQQNGTDRVLRSVQVGPTSPFAPAFPNTLSAIPPSTSIDIRAVSADFADLYASQANLQLERQLTPDLSVTVGYIYSKGTRIPIRRNVNVVPSGSFLADGRPIFGSERVDPQFNNVQVVESVGNSQYNAGFLQLNRRFSRGFQFIVSYTYSHGIDDAPEVNILEGEGEISDPTNRARERGNSRSDLRHNLTFSTVLRPRAEVENAFLRGLLNDNQFAFIGRFTSGEYFSIEANRNINGLTGTDADRPLFIGRNTANLPNWRQVDMRYSRYVPVYEDMRLEVFGEFTNLFNIRNVVSQIGTVSVDSNGVLLNPLPNRFPDNTFNESRQFQLGFRFLF